MSRCSLIVSDSEGDPVSPSAVLVSPSCIEAPGLRSPSYASDKTTSPDGERYSNAILSSPTLSMGLSS